MAADLERLGRKLFSGRGTQEVTSYKAALETAMKDGKITEDEQSILLSLRKTLGISDLMHEELFNSLSNNQ